MYSKPLPIMQPVFFEGEYKKDNVYPLYIQVITCSFKLKKNKIPTIQLKNNISYMQNEYITTSNNQIECLVLTNIDLQLFKEQYDITDYKCHYGFKFKAMTGLFKEYIDKWIERKNQGTIEKNPGKRTEAKLMLNSLYGKFAMQLEGRSKIPFLGEDEIIHYTTGELEDRKGLYIPVGSFITSYARELTIRTSQAIMDYSIEKYGVNKYYYSDTDSIHCGLTIDELKQFCDIDNVKLGAWKHEGTFTRARFIRAKCYIEEIDGKINITCAGMSNKCYDKVTWENFKSGLTVSGNLKPKTVKGGIILVESPYTIKEEKVKKNIKDFDKIIEKRKKQLKELKQNYQKFKKESGKNK